MKKLGVYGMILWGLILLSACNNTQLGKVNAVKTASDESIVMTNKTVKDRTNENKIIHENKYEESAGQECEKEVTEEMTQNNKDEISELIKTSEYKKVKHDVLFFLGNSRQDVEAVYGEPDDKLTGEGTSMTLYKERGIIFGSAFEQDEILFIRPVAGKSMFGIKNQMILSEVIDCLGEGEMIFDYTEGEGRIAHQYKIENFNVRVIFYSGKVYDIVVTKNNDVEIEDDNLKLEIEVKDKVTDETIETEDIIGFLREEDDYIREHLGVYEGSFLGEQQYRDRYAFIYRELGIAFVRGFENKFMDSVVFINREVLGINHGMSRKQVEEILGKPEKQGYVSTTHNEEMYQLTYSKEIMGKKHNVTVYLDRKEGVIYFIEIAIIK